MIKRPYPPGQKGKRRTRALSEYGKELKEKQKLKNCYNLREKQFANYVKEVLQYQGKVKDVADLLIKILESRLDGVIFRLGLAASRKEARQMVSHGLFLVNGKAIDIPSYRVKKGDIITIKPTKLKKAPFQDLAAKLKKQKSPSWLAFDIKNLEGTVIGEPSFEETAPPAEIASIFEYYSR